MTTELYAALAKANTEITDPVKNAYADAEKYGYAYASLDQVLGHVRPILAKNGLSIVQDVHNDADGIYITTTLLHASGASLAFGPISWPPVSKMQDFGAVATYARRYGVLAALGIATAEDTDAAGIDATTTGTGVDVPGHLRGPAARQAARDVSKTCSSRQLGLIKQLMDAHNLSEALLPDAVDITTPAAGLEHMTSREASKLIDALKALPQDRPIMRGPLSPDTDPWVTGPPPDDPWASTPTTTTEEQQ